MRVIDGGAKRRVCTVQTISASLSIEDPPRMKPCLKRSAGNRSAEGPPVPRVSHGASVDMKRRKRVKFVERDALRASSCHRNVSSLVTEKSHASSGDDDPKTSEYKSFKRLLEEAGRSSHSYEPVRWRNSSPSDRMEDMRNKHTCNGEATVTVLQVEKVTPIKQLPSLSAIGALDDQGLLNFGEPQYKNGGTFAEKRQNVIKSAASTLSLEVKELILEGHDLIPVLLNRLGIKREADNCDKLQKANIMNSNARSQLLTCPNIQNSLEEPFETLGTKCCSAFVRDIAENNFPSGWRNRANELCRSTEGVEVQLFPVWNMRNKDLSKNPSYSYFLLDSPYLPARKEIDLEFNPNTEEAASRCKQPVLNDKISMTGRVNQLSSFWDIYEEQLVPWHSNFHLPEFDILPGPNRSKRFSRQQSSLPLLGWNEELNNGEDAYVAPDSAETKGRYQLPLALYHVPLSHAPIRDSEGLDSCTGGTFFHSVGDIRIPEDTIYPSADHCLLPSTTKFAVGSDWEDLSVDYTREFLLPYNTNRQFGHISSNAFQRCLVEPSDTDDWCQITGTVCNACDLSSFGFGISPEVFLAATEE